ncbi:retrovirus-related pol polyprotein from transposon TNT 1-94 [Tanacetum coccineum]
MTTLAEHIIVARAENRPPMLEKSMYDSWASRICLFIKGKKHGKMMLDSIDNGLLVYPTVEENGQNRPMKYFKLTKAQQLQEDCDVQATNIILHGLPPDVYALVNHQEAAKEIRIEMTMQQVQVNTKFLNAIPSERSKFITDVKLAKSLYTTNYDQLYAYLSQHERHANKFSLSSVKLSERSCIREDPIECINKAMAFLSAIASRFPLSNNQLRTSSNPRNQETIQDGIATTSKGNYVAGQPRVVKCYNCQGEGHMVRQCTQRKRPRNAAWFKEKLMLAKAQEASQILDEEQLAFLADPRISEALVAKAVLMANLLSCDPEVLSEDTNPSAPNDLLVLSLVEQMTDHVAHLDKENQTNKMAKRIQPTLYDGSVIAKEHVVIYVIDDEETLILEEESRSKMLDKQNDLISIEKKIKISLIDYSKLNKIKEDFGKHFVTQKELSAEQAFWLKHSSFSETPVKSHTLVRVECPSELPKSCVNDCCKCLELETKLLKKKDFIEKEAYNKLVKSYSTLEKHFISLELVTQLNQEIFQRENSSENLNAPTFNQLFEINKLKAQLQENDTVIRKLKERIKSLSGKDCMKNVKKDIDEIETINIELEHSVAKLLSENENLRKEREHLKSIYNDQFDSIRKTRVQSKEHCDSLIAQINAKKLKGKNVVNTAVSKPNATIAPGMFKLDIEHISPRLKNNRDAHEIAEPVTSSSNIAKQTDSLKTTYSNKPLLTSTRVKPTTSASGSKPSGNTKNNRITRPPSRNQKNRVEDHSRKLRSSLNKTNSVLEPVSNVLVKHSVRNVKFESICAICNKCLFDTNHDMCIIDYVNVRSKSKSKRNKMRKVWKLTGKVFTDVGYKWKPIKRFFTIVGNSCPLTRITPKKIVHLRETTSKSVETPKPDIKAYGRRPKQGSNATDVSFSSSLVNDRLSSSFSDLNVHIQSILYFLRFRISPESSGRQAIQLLISAVTGQFLHQVEFFEGWKPLSSLQLVVEEVMSE